MGRLLLNLGDHALLVGLLAVLALVGLGMLAIASATVEQPGREGLWQRQLVWLTVGALLATVVFIIDYHFWAEFSLALHGVVILLLVLVLFIGTEVGGNRSWLVVGPVRLQPSELAKWTTCLVLASYLTNRVRGSMGLRQMVEMGVLVGAPVMLIALQPDLGTALLVAVSGCFVLFLSGLRWRVILGFAALAAASSCST